MSDTIEGQGGEDSSPKKSSRLRNANQQLADMANAAGISVVIDEDAAPVVKIDEDLNVTAKRLGDIVARLDLYEMNGEQVFFDHRGEMRPMTAKKFVTWINQEVVICR